MNSLLFLAYLSEMNVVGFSFFLINKCKPSFLLLWKIHSNKGILFSASLSSFLVFTGLNKERVLVGSYFLFVKNH
ncbi:MAG: hypothetical protein COB98_09295 [Flavobacteriaceae bacterium]|nr:MAG: hypothetical protein COB98_09295 [Flavobacteriaceae bacterium]